MRLTSQVSRENRRKPPPATTAPFSTRARNTPSGGSNSCSWTEVISSPGPYRFSYSSASPSRSGATCGSLSRTWCSSTPQSWLRPVVPHTVVRHPHSGTAHKGPSSCWGGSSLRSNLGRQSLRASGSTGAGQLPAALRQPSLALVSSSIERSVDPQMRSAYQS